MNFFFCLKKILIPDFRFQIPDKGKSRDRRAALILQCGMGVFDLEFGIWNKKTQPAEDAGCVQQMLF
jgi:hypothetical protein